MIKIRIKMFLWEKVMNSNTNFIYFIFGLFLLYFMPLSFLDKNYIIISLFIVIGGGALINIVSDNRFISINKLHWYFQFIFMFWAPLYQYLTKYYPWNFFIDEKFILYAQVVNIVWCFTYMFFYKSRQKNFFSEKNFLLKEIYLIKARNSKLVLLFLATILFCIYVNLIGFNNLFFRNLNILDLGNSTLSFVVRKFLSAFPVLTCAVFIVNNKIIKTRFNLIAIYLLMFMAILANFPTSTTRYWMGTLFLGLIILLIKIKEKSRLFDYGLLIIFFCIFPIFYVFKRNSIVDIFIGKGIDSINLISCFNSIDFDAFTLIARSIMYVKEYGITYGEQLLNIVLFFIPRGIWLEKPIATNILVVSSQNQAFTNLSCPLPAEGFVNFGIIGVLLYASVFALISKYLDEKYWNDITIKDSSILKIIYPFLCVITIYVCRGPLQPAFIQTLMLISPIFIIYLLIKVMEKNKDLKK